MLQGVTRRVIVIIVSKTLFNVGTDLQNNSTDATCIHRQWH